MKRPVTVLAALLLTLVVTAPAAAAKPVVEFSDLPFVEEFHIPAGELCDFPVTYRGEGVESLKFWFAQGADPATDPWVKGLYQKAGTDSFIANGNTVAGRYRFSSHLYDLVIGDPVTWWETTSGKYWGITIPGTGRVFHEAGNFRQVVEAITDDPETWIYTQLREPRGSAVFDDLALCEALAD